jgi:hypothetical protein
MPNVRSFAAPFTFGADSLPQIVSKPRFRKSRRSLECRKFGAWLWCVVAMSDAPERVYGQSRDTDHGLLVSLACAITSVALGQLARGANVEN